MLAFLQTYQDAPLFDKGIVAAEQMQEQFNRPQPVLTDSEEAELRGYDWPGNVRELRNVIERAVLLSRDGRLALNLPAGPIQG